VHFEDTSPKHIVDGTPANPVKSAFQTDIVSIKVRANAAWCVAPGGAAVIEGVNW
jgi:hypothetical protein